MMNKEYDGALYESYNYKSVFEQLDTNKSYYLSNERDKPHYAYMTWRMHERGKSHKYKEQGEGYFVSSIILLEQCLIENRDRKGDGLIFPILFNIEQGIELYIKALIYLSSENGASIAFRVMNHDIRTLRSEFGNMIMSYDNNLANTALRDFDYLDKFMGLLFEKTSDCTYARFPYDSSNNEHFYVDASENIIVDMKVLLEWSKSIFYILDRNYYLLSSELESRGVV